MSKVLKTEFVIKEETAFRLKIRHWKALSPNTLNSVEFVQECLNKDGEVDFASTYNFLMSNNEIKEMIKGLESITND